MLEDPAHTPVFSVASLWELVIKQALGRPDFTVQPPLLRRDPFDRLLLAQASAEGLLLITADHQLAQYPAPVRLMPA
jgi:PIN domain nuclease of toxin-antitoxin system